MLLDVLENLFHFDAKLFRNIVTLLFLPGRLSAAFNAGKRAAQMPPLRLYIFVSVLFFFVSFLTPESPGGNAPLISTSLIGQVGFARAGLVVNTRALAAAATDPAAKQRLVALAAQLNDPTAKDLVLSEEQLHDLPPGLVKQIRAAMAAERARPSVTSPGAAKPAAKTRPGPVADDALAGYLAEKGKYAYEHQPEIREIFAHSLPKMLLVCLPLFALYTRLLFRHSGQVYLQHLVVALHFHTFIFLWRLVANGWVFLAHLVSPRLAMLLNFSATVWLGLYAFLMLRHLFNNSWPRTIGKTLILALAYGATLGIGLLATATIIFLVV